MLTSQTNVKPIDQLTDRIAQVIGALGESVIDGQPYNTAWVARLAAEYPDHGFDQSLRWLRQHQRDDGTWGADILHYHDRFISTLAAIVALRVAGRDSRDARRIARGEQALWRVVGYLGRDDSDTIGFPMLVRALTREAQALGLDVPRAPIRYEKAVVKKIAMLEQMPVAMWRQSPASYSYEGLLTELSIPDLQQENGSILISPSATAGALLVNPGNAQALAFLKQVIAEEGTGGAPELYPEDIVEIAWVLNSFRAVGAITPDNPDVIRLLDHLWGLWDPVKGVGSSRYNFPEDVDNTAATYTLLRWAGYPVNADVLRHYERDAHFACFPIETNPSPSAHARIAVMLRHAADEPGYEGWQTKVMAALQSFDENGVYWWDKWHASPYYATGLVVDALSGIADDMVQPRIRWIERTQRDDGGWGYYDRSTPEETAYCLTALLHWYRSGQPVESVIMEQAVAYLRAHLDDAEGIPLWIGKALYNPRLVVKAAILSSLYFYEATV